MTLNLESNKGILSYCIDGKDFGIAFDDIHVNKAYILAVSLWDNEKFAIN